MTFVLMASKFQDIQLKTKRVQDWAAKVDLKINEKKTKTMKINPKVHEKIQIDNKPVEDIDDFTYLGSKISVNGGTTEDIKLRTQKARAAFIALKYIWKSTAYSTHSKLKIYKRSAKSVLLYGVECWKTTREDLNISEAFQNRCLRRILKIYWPNKISNKELLERTKIESIGDNIKKRRWSYIGHILRRDENTKVVMTWAPEGKRKKGRPKETWRRTVERERQEMG